jgi:hypothetical protein
MTKNVIIQNYYDKTINGLKGVITNIFHDKDCLYTQGKWAEVKLENGTQKILRTCFLRGI